MSGWWTWLKVRMGLGVPCEWVRERFVEYYDFELPRSELAALKRHIRRCPGCRDEWQAFEEVREWFGRAAADPLYDPTEVERRLSRMMAAIKAYEAVPGVLRIAR